MIGKGNRGSEVVKAIKTYSSVYFAAVGGAGALYSQCIKSCEVIAFEELGCESIKRLEVQDFPLLVAIDSLGETLYK
jgi:fumarate hydratase subunit beta